MRGRPQTYNDKWVKDHTDKLPDLFKEGQSVAEVCVELGMCKDTFYRLCNEYPEFSYAYKKGLEMSEAWWTRLGRHGAAGAAEINPTTWIFNMKNRFKWADRHEVKQDINMSIQDMSDDDLDRELSQLDAD